MCESIPLLFANTDTANTNKTFIVSETSRNHYAWTTENIDFDLAHIERTLSTHVKGNDRKGMVGEKVTVTYLEELKAEFETGHPTWTMDIHHNEFTPKKYRKNRGKGVDIMVYLRHANHTVKTLALECKNYTNRKLTPHNYRTHVETRFAYVDVNAIKILVSHGITNKVNKITHITHDIKTMLRYIITSALPPHSQHYKPSPLPLYSLYPCIPHSIQQSNIISICLFHKFTVIVDGLSLYGCG